MKNDHICIDGKTLRRSFDDAKKTSAIHMVNAWSTGLSLSLGQLKSEGKKNEIKAIPILKKELKRFLRSHVEAGDDLFKLKNTLKRVKNMEGLNVENAKLLLRRKEKISESIF